MLGGDVKSSGERVAAYGGLCVDVVKWKDTSGGLASSLSTLAGRIWFRPFKLIN